MRDLRLDNLVADRIEDQLTDRLNMQFVHYSGAVVINGSFADMEGSTNFFVAFAFSEQLNDFAFSDTKPFVVLTDKRSFLMT